MKEILMYSKNSAQNESAIDHGNCHEEKVYNTRFLAVLLTKCEVKIAIENNVWLNVKIQEQLMKTNA